MTNEDLSDCAGYRVEVREARLGTVTAVVPRTGRDERGVLMVRSDAPGCSLSAIPSDEVESVDVGQRRIVLLSRTPKPGSGVPPMAKRPAGRRVERTRESNAKGDVMFKTIIWATDGSESADRALPTALDLTAEGHGKLLVVHADALLGGRGGGVPVIADEQDVQSELVSKVNELVESGIDASFRVVKGTNRDPADLIADVAREVDADLIIVGTRGHGRVVGMLLGSVTQRLLHVAPCPVLAVPVNVAVTDVVGAA